MKKIVFLSLLFLTFSNAAFVYDNKCIDDYFFYNNNFYYHVIGSSSYTAATFTAIQENQILKGFKYQDGKCLLDSNATALNMPLSSFSFLMALSGLLMGFAFTFTILILLSRR
ncbi:MAG: hypothetical protein ACWGHH_05685 [Sulfurovaceae bacterium]